MKKDRNWYWRLIDIDFNNSILIDIYHYLSYLHLQRSFSFAHRIFTISAPSEAVGNFYDWNTILTSIFVISVAHSRAPIYLSDFGDVANKIISPGRVTFILRGSQMPFKWSQLYRVSSYRVNL